MSKYFFDTNALVKYYYQYELGSEVVNPLIQDEANKCFISNWGIIEFHSALGRIVRGNKLTKKQFYKLISRFRADTDAKVFILENIPKLYIKKASNLIIKIGVERKKGLNLSSGDSIQLLAFEELRKRFPDICMVTSDKVFGNICSELGYSLIDPENL